ncbi:hypothetical protein V8F33_012344 [Rhypophila sp. PSN 637]
MELLSFLLALFWAQVASSHMVMNTPAIYSPNRASTWPVTNGGRFPYPCQGFTEIVTRTPITAGGTTLVNFTGSAPHGGGTCLFGLNYHSTPASPYTNDPEHFKTIYTIIGGCPADTAGNLETPDTYRGLDPNGNPDSVHCGNDSGKDCIRQFNIPFPDDLPSGNATFVWMWYNQRTKNELYMNCAPVYIDGKQSDTAPEDSPFVNSLPTMFLANVPGLTECATSQTGDQTGPFNVPNPGNFGVQLITPDPIAAGNCSIAPVAPFASSGTSMPTPALASTPAAAPTTSSAGFVTVTTSTAGYSSPASTPSEISATTSSEIPATTPVATTPAAPSSQSTAPPPASTGGAATPGSPVDCNVPAGTLFCISESEFGICGPDGKGYPQQLNANQICIDGNVYYKDESA